MLNIKPKNYLNMSEYFIMFCGVSALRIILNVNSFCIENDCKNDAIYSDGFTEDDAIALIMRAYLMRFLDLILGILMADPNKLLPVMNIPLQIQKLFLPGGTDD